MTGLEHVLDRPDRLEEIAAHHVLEPDLRARLSEISLETAVLLGVPVGLVTVLVPGAQLFVGSHGVQGWLAEAGGTPVEWSFCAQVVSRRAAYVVQDATEDALHRDSPLVTRFGVRTYAGVPVTVGAGHVIGAHCVTGAVPRWYSRSDLRCLEAGAVRVVEALAQHRAGWDPADRLARGRARPQHPRSVSGCT